MTMYTPPPFRESNPEKLTAFLHANSFGELITVRDGQPLVTHLPFLFAPGEGKRGVLYAHVARANGQWRAGDSDAVAVFRGPHHYISPTWYAAPGTVPTWNYLAVHVHGHLEWIDSEASRRDVLERLVNSYESVQPSPWSADFESSAIRAEARLIVTLRMEVQEIEGTWKLNQHHPIERQVRTARALRAQGTESAHAIASLMEQNIARQRREQKP